MRVLSLHRYPVKSMLGEQVSAAEITTRGLTGDRGFALVDGGTGLVASAKHPSKWARLLQCTATLHEGAVSIALPDGATTRSDDPAVHDVLSAFCGRRVVLQATPPDAAHLEREWPDIELAPADVRQRVVTPIAGGAPGTFFDYAPVHIVTTSSLRALQAAGHDDPVPALRFRPNILLDTPEEGFVENDWAGRRLTIGDVVLEILTQSPRCAVPALAHGAAPADPAVLRAVVAGNRIDIRGGRYACVGVYGRVVMPGHLKRGMAAGLAAS